MTATAAPESLLREAATSLQDPEGRELAAHVRWWHLPGLDAPAQARWPVAVIGEGPPLLLLHGFDSSFLEFRRLAPLLAADHTLVIPDLYGFGFTPERRTAPTVLTGCSTISKPCWTSCPANFPSPARRRAARSASV